MQIIKLFFAFVLFFLLVSANGFAAGMPSSSLPNKPLSITIAAFLTDQYLGRDVSYSRKANSSLTVSKVVGITRAKNGDYVFNLDNSDHIRVVFYEQSRGVPRDHSKGVVQGSQQQILQMEQMMNQSLANMLNSGDDDSQNGDNSFQTANQFGMPDTSGTGMDPMAGIATELSTQPNYLSISDSRIRYLNKMQKSEDGIPDFISTDNRLVLRNGVHLAQKFERL